MAAHPHEADATLGYQPTRKPLTGAENIGGLGHRQQALRL
jgi:hypothetical protein